jgi:NAD-dependent DNA ligase
MAEVTETRKADRLERVKLRYPPPSIPAVKSIDEAVKMIRYYQEQDEDGACVVYCEPKVDGINVALRYELQRDTSDGWYYLLAEATTRGKNGYGSLINHHMPHIVFVPEAMHSSVPKAMGGFGNVEHFTVVGEVWSAVQSQPQVSGAIRRVDTGKSEKFDLCFSAFETDYLAAYDDDELDWISYREWPTLVDPDIKDVTDSKLAAQVRYQLLESKHSGFPVDNGHALVFRVCSKYDISTHPPLKPVARFKLKELR